MNFAGSVVFDSARETVWHLLEDAEGILRSLARRSRGES